MTADAFDPTRLEISYELQSSGDRHRVTLPFAIAVLADLTGKPAEPPPPLADRKLRDISRDNFDSVLASYHARVSFLVPNCLSEEVSDRAAEGDANAEHVKAVAAHGLADEVLLVNGQLAVELVFRSLDDFGADAVVRRVPLLNRLIEVRWVLANARDRLGASVTLATHVADWLSGSGDAPPALARELDETPLAALRLLASQSAPPADPQSLRSWMDTYIAKIDDLVSRQVTHILRHPDFQRLEGSWRGLWFLVDRLPAGARVKCRAMSVSRRELDRELRTNTDITQSALLSMLAREFEEFGGEPASIVVGDYAFDHDDTLLLHSLSRLAAAVHAVFIAAVSPTLFQLDSVAELSRLRDLGKVLTTPEYASWRALRESTFASYVVLALPRMLARAPYLLNEADGHPFNFEEPAGGDVQHYVWANAAYALGERLAATWHRTGWFDGFLGVDGGIVEGLPVHTFQALEGDAVTFCPTEVPLPDRVVEKLVSLGLAPFVHCRDTDYAVFFEAPTLGRPTAPKRDQQGRMAGERAALAEVLARNYFTSTIRAMVRDTRSRFRSVESMKHGLDAWIQQYVRSGDAEGAGLAPRPLRSARVGIVRAPQELGGVILRVIAEPALAPRRPDGPVAHDVELGLDYLRHFGDS